MKNYEILKLFPEPIFKYKLENFTTFNKDLAAYIYDLRKMEKQGLKRSNRGG